MPQLPAHLPANPGPIKTCSPEPKVRCPISESSIGKAVRKDTWFFLNFSHMLFKLLPYLCTSSSISLQETSRFPYYFPISLLYGSAVENFKIPRSSLFPDHPVLSLTFPAKASLYLTPLQCYHENKLFRYEVSSVNFCCWQRLVKYKEPNSNSEIILRVWG